MTRVASESTASQSVKSFWLKALLFAMLVIALDFIAGSLLDRFYFTQKSGFYYQTTYSMNESMEQLLIFGSSKATHQYVPDVFENKLHLSYYNAGRDGSSIFYHFSVLQATLKRHKPEMIIIDVARDFVKDQDSYDRIAMLLPYMKHVPELKNVVMLRGPFEKYKLLSKSYPFNSLIFSIMAGNTGLQREKNETIKGYSPLNKVWDKPIETLAYANRYQIDSVKVTYFENFVKLCTEQKIKLYVVSAPHYYKLMGKEKSLEIVQRICAKYNVKVFDFTDSKLFQQTPAYFADLGHLNATGAHIFSEMVADQINKDLIPVDKTQNPPGQ